MRLSSISHVDEMDKKTFQPTDLGATQIPNKRFPDP
jgi:hypothetical protein